MVAELVVDPLEVVKVEQDDRVSRLEKLEQARQFAAVQKAGERVGARGRHELAGALGRPGSPRSQALADEDPDPDRDGELDVVGRREPAGTDDPDRYRDGDRREDGRGPLGETHEHVGDGEVTRIGRGDPSVRSAVSMSEPTPTAGNTSSDRGGRRSQGRRVRPSVRTMAPAERASTIERSASLTGSSQMVQTMTMVHAPLKPSARCAPERESSSWKSSRRAKFIKGDLRHRCGRY